MSASNVVSPSQSISLVSQPYAPHQRFSELERDHNLTSATASQTNLDCWLKNNPSQKLHIAETTQTYWCKYKQGKRVLRIRRLQTPFPRGGSDTKLVKRRFKEIESKSSTTQKPFPCIPWGGGREIVAKPGVESKSKFTH